MKQFKIRASACGKIMGVRGLGKTGESYVKEWMIEQTFKRRKSFSNKYTEKGLIMEDNAIDYAAEQLGYGMLIKNETFFEGDYFHGTPDVITKDEVIDIKCSYTPFTFPFFEDEIPTKDYYYQLQVYMHLTGRKKAKLVYCLMDTPENLIHREVSSYAYKNGVEVDDELVAKFKADMTFQDIPAEKKIKVFDIEYDEKVIELIIKRVEECRKIVSLRA